MDRHPENLAAEVVNGGVDAGPQRLLEGIDDRIEALRVERTRTDDLRVEPVLKVVHIGYDEVVTQIGHLPDLP